MIHIPFMSALYTCFLPKRGEVTRERRTAHNEELQDLYSSPNIIRVIKTRSMRWVGLVARMKERYIHSVGGET